MTEEIWKDIEEYPGYQVSSFGRVRTHNKNTYTQKHGCRKWKDRVLKYKGNTYKTGYRVDLWKNGKNKTFLVARLTAFTFLQQDINNLSLTVNHIDGNRFNNHISNLEIIPLKENIQHAFRTGLIHTPKKIKIIDRVTGTIIYPSSLSEGSRLIGFNDGYLSNKINNDEWQNNRYSWELLKESA